jgi:uncharacterized protein YaaQ
VKLLIAVVHRRDARRLQAALVEGGFRFTEISSTGGFLGEGNMTLLLGVETAQVPEVLALVHQHCQAREEIINATQPDSRMVAAPSTDAMAVQVGGATVFVLDVETVVQV